MCVRACLRACIRVFHPYVFFSDNNISVVPIPPCRGKYPIPYDAIPCDLIPCDSIPSHSIRLHSISIGFDFHWIRFHWIRFDSIPWDCIALAFHFSWTSPRPRDSFKPGEGRTVGRPRVSARTFRWGPCGTFRVSSLWKVLGDAKMSPR